MELWGLASYLCKQKHPSKRVFLVRRAGIEPATTGLKGPCSTAELPAHMLKMLGKDSRILCFWEGALS